MEKLAGALVDAQIDLNPYKLQAQKAVKALEAERSRKRRDLFEAQDGIDRQREELIGRIEKQVRQVHRIEPLFTVRWTLT